MSNPAIVLMTDPSRCSLGDVHYLVQALLEMRQMGEDATSQAFCDHPAAAKDFIAAYAHAYPQLVLEDREIPTPDHLESLIATGQIGALGRPTDLASLGGMPRPAEQNGMSGFPIVVLTLGSAPALIDALQQSPVMKDSIRLIDIVPDGADAPVSVAEAVAVHGLEGGSWEHEGGDRPQLDEVGGASTTDSGSLALHDDRMSLDVVEAAKTPDDAATTAYQNVEPETGAGPPSSATAQPELAGATPQAAAPALPEDSYQASATVEPAPQAAPPVDTAWSSGVKPVEPTPTDATDELAAQEPKQEPDQGADPDGGEQQGQQDQDKPVQSGKPVQDADHHEQHAPAPDHDDVYYPPVGSLVEGADVLYPALDQAAAQGQDGAFGVLRELAAAMLDDGMVDPDLTGQMLAQQDDLLPPAARHDEIPTFHSDSHHAVTIEDLYGSFDHDSDDPLADDALAPPPHDSDL